MANRLLVVVLLLLAFHHKGILGSHFRGGTISWRATGHGNQVEFDAKTGWVYGQHCNESVVGVYQNRSAVQWVCSSGCQNRSVVNQARPGTTCTGVSIEQNWEKTENIFTYTFQGVGPYVIEYASSAWINSVGGGSWNISTTVDLRKRSDTGQANRSPLVSSKPMYYVKYSCTDEIQLPVVDADSDLVTCRWAVGNECMSVCYNATYGSSSAAVASLDPNTCKVTIDANHMKNKMYALAIVFEDRPRNTITVGGRTYTPNDVLSSVPMQFLVQTPDIPARRCQDKPVFVDPTPASTDVIIIEPGDTLYLSAYATSAAAQVIAFTLLDPPRGMSQSAIRSDERFRQDVYATDLMWSPTVADIGLKTFCIDASDNYTMSSRWCTTVQVLGANPCDSSPCQNNATCSRKGYTDMFQCACAAGYTGNKCETDIDECVSNPCFNNGTCFDLINGYRCDCVLGFTDTECQTDINECLTQSCEHGGTCRDLIGYALCDCAPGFTGTACETDIDECTSNPCFNNATCFNLINEYFCGCQQGFTGSQCQTDINECLTQPCENGGTCRDLIGYALCDCAPGFTGTACETDIDECTSNPCFNNVTCFDLVNEYFCGCQQGFTGPQCQTDINECLTQPCENGGTCRDLIGYALCECPRGFTGTVCQIGVDMCVTMPCQNGGRCKSSGPGDFSCDCRNGWQGEYCEYMVTNSSNPAGLMVSENIQYSDCSCVFGTKQQDLCSTFTNGKTFGYGALGALLGLLTSILMYLLFGIMYSNHISCCHGNELERKLNTNFLPGSINKVVPEPEVTVNSVPDDGKAEVRKTETRQTEVRPIYRRSHCYACQFKQVFTDMSKPIWLR